MSETPKVLLNVLYLVNKETFITKMSRVRFHAMNALSKITNMTWWGLNWENYDNALTVKENTEKNYPDIYFDMVISYKPLELKEFNNLQYPKCITYNEMYDFNQTVNEIEASNVDLVICHHENDMKTYMAYYSNYHGQKNKHVKFVHIPHSAEQTIFKDYGYEKNIDVLVCGRLNCKNTLGDSHYPLRDRVAKLIDKFPKKYNCQIHKHPKSQNADSYTDKYLIDFAQIINRSKICVSCCGLPKTRFGKCVEIPMCNTLMCSDIPAQDQEDFKKFTLEITLDMTDNEIINKIVNCLENKQLLESMTKYGYDWSQNYTQEKYAERFVKVIEDFLG